MPNQPNREIYAFSVTIPAGTAQASPVTVNTAMPPRLVNEIDIVVPPGPSGLVGFQIAMAGVPIIPRNAGTWIITDDEKIYWPLTGAADSGAWQVIGYNTDIFDHTIQVRYLVDLAVKPPQGGTAASLPAGSISAAAGAGTLAAQLASMAPGPPVSVSGDAHGLAAAAARPAQIAARTIETAHALGEITDAQRSAELAALKVAQR